MLSVWQREGPGAQALRPSALGDVRIALRRHVAGEALGPAVALAVAATAPTGSADALSGSGGVTSRRRATTRGFVCHMGQRPLWHNHRCGRAAKDDVPAPREMSAAQVFDVVWTTIIDVLGTAATATLLRRALRNAAKNRPDLTELEGFDVVREDPDFRVVLPPSWSTCRAECIDALGHLVRGELTPLLRELTGPVVIRLLEREPELQRSGILGERGDRR